MPDRDTAWTEPLPARVVAVGAVLIAVLVTAGAAVWSGALPGPQVIWWTAAGVFLMACGVLDHLAEKHQPPRVRPPAVTPGLTFGQQFRRNLRQNGVRTFVVPFPVVFGAISSGSILESVHGLLPGLALGFLPALVGSAATMYAAEWFKRRRLRQKEGSTAGS